MCTTKYPNPLPAIPIRARFTLVEMLVVIAIIGILASLLMPSLSKALDSARRTACAVQFKMCGFAAQQYGNDNNSTLLMRLSSSSGTLWAKHLINFGYIPDWRAAVCNIQPHQKNFNAYLTHGINYHYSSSKYEIQSANGGDYLKLNKIPAAGKFLLFAESVPYITDGNYPNGYWKFSATDWPNSTNGNIYYRHQGFAICLFADGHAAYYDNPYALRPFGIRRTVMLNGDCISLP